MKFSSGFLVVTLAFILMSPQTSKAQVPPAIGSKKVAVVLFNFLNNSTDRPITTEQVKEKIFTGPDSVRAYYREASYGLLDIVGKNNLDGDVFGWYTIGHLYNQNVCENLPSIFSSAATINAFFSGVDLSNYDFIFFLFKVPGNCNPPTWNGYTGYREAWLNVDSLLGGSRTAAHEFAHGLRLNGHTNDYVCRDSGRIVPLSSPNNCSIVDYGDYTTILGNADNFSNGKSFLNHLNAFHKLLLGWLNPVIHLKTLDGSIKKSTIAIRPLERLLGDNDIKLINIPNFDRHHVDESLYIDYRQPVGFDARGIFGSNFGGVRLYIGKNQSNVAVQAASTLAVSGPDSIWLKPGQSIIVPESGTKITTLSSDNAGAVVRVEFLGVKIEGGGGVTQGLVTVRANTTGDVARVRLYANDILLGEMVRNTNSDIYTREFDTRRLPTGSTYTILAVAETPKQLSVVSEPVTIVVSGNQIIGCDQNYLNEVSAEIVRLKSRVLNGDFSNGQIRANLEETIRSYTAERQRCSQPEPSNDITPPVVTLVQPTTIPAIGGLNRDSTLFTFLAQDADHPISQMSARLYPPGDAPDILVANCGSRANSRSASCNFSANPRTLNLNSVLLLGAKDIVGNLGIAIYNFSENKPTPCPNCRPIPGDLFPSTVTNLHLLSPNGGELLRPGETTMIRWSANVVGTASRVSLSLINQQNLIVRDIGQVDASLLSYNWSVPADLAADWYRVGITDSSGEVGDVSDAPVLIGSGICNN